MRGRPGAVGELGGAGAGRAAEVVAQAERVTHLVHHERLERLVDVGARDLASGRDLATRRHHDPREGGALAQSFAEPAEPRAAPAPEANESSCSTVRTADTGAT